ncbi:serine/threonine protein kinase, AGC, partial [Quaeritorhiza haematococci]
MPSRTERGSVSAPDMPYARRDYDLSDFEILDQIGRGAFAKVHLVRFAPRLGEGGACTGAAGVVGRGATARSRYKPQQSHLAVPTPTSAAHANPPPLPPKTYAMKSLSKKTIIATKQTKHVMNEKNILESARHPFIVELLATFQDRDHLYIVMEYIVGGDMFTHLRKHRRFKEEVARFYASELVLAVEYLHSKNIVYRDLKPENVLLDAGGHIKIADFGFAKVITDTSNTFCGTPAYMAPEIILKTGYTKAVDWWSLGIVTYELMAGYTPFYADSHIKIYENIVSGDMKWSSQIQNAAKDLIRKLLEMMPRRRLGSAPGMQGGRDVRAHPWFRGVQWKALEGRQVPAPFVPS